MDCEQSSMKIQLFLKIIVLKNLQSSVENTCVAGPLSLQLLETPTQVFSYKIFKNIFLYRTTPVTAF